MPSGRPSSYKPEYAEQAEKLCKLGATDPELADFFGVDPETIRRWSHAHEAFCGALKAGKSVADDRVERSLYQRAIGYKQKSVKIFMPAGAAEPVYAPFEENVAPDTTACIFWLKNRRRQEWRDVYKHEGQNADNPGSMTSDELRDRVAREVEALGINGGRAKAPGASRAPERKPH